jgi:tetratricopeptide (TPR) repeat protein
MTAMVRHSWVSAICFLIVLLCPASLNAQNLDSIQSLPEKEQIMALRQYLFPKPGEDTNSVYDRFESYETYFKKKGNERLRRQAWFMRYELASAHIYLWSPYSLALTDQALEIAKDRGWRCEEAKLKLHKGSLLHEYHKFSAGFEYMIEGLDILREVGIASCPEGFTGLVVIANAYSKFGDSETAIKYFREALSLPEEYMDSHFRKVTYNGMGLAFKTLHQYDSAIHCFTRTYEEAKKLNDKFYMALANGNKGSAYFLKNDFNNALPYLLDDFNVSNELGETGSAANASLNIAAIYISWGMPEKAEPFIQYAGKHTDRTDVRIMSGYYKNQFEIYRLRKDFAKALLYVDSFHVARDSVMRTADGKLIDRARMTVYAEQHAREVTALEAARSRQILIRNGLLIMIALFGIIAYQWYHRQQLRREKEKQVAAMREAMAEEELRNAQRELEIFTQKLTEKNELIDSFRTEIEQIQATMSEPEPTQNAYLSQLIHATILTDDDWQQFRMLFDKVYPGFFVRLKEKMPDLSPADTRLLALTKLKLSAREMASMLGINADSIKKSRQRLRKKINLPEEGSLEEVVAII